MALAVKTPRVMTTQGAARTIRPPTEGFADVSTSTTPETVDLSRYAGRWVKIYCEDQAHYVCFAEAASATMVTGAAATVGEAYVADMIDAGGVGMQCLVDPEFPILIYRSVTSTGKIRVIPR